MLARSGRPSVYLAACCFAWGTITMCTGLCKHFGHLLTIRILLGVVEAAFVPGAIFVLSKWYTKRESESAQMLRPGE